MNIHVLVAARQDLEDGFEFYEQQEPGIGAYFLRTLQAEIASLDGHAGSIADVLATITGCCDGDSLSPCTTESGKTRF